MHGFDGSVTKCFLTAKGSKHTLHDLLKRRQSLGEKMELAHSYSRYRPLVGLQLVFLMLLQFTWLPYHLLAEHSEHEHQSFETHTQHADNSSLYVDHLDEHCNDCADSHSDSDHVPHSPSDHNLVYSAPAIRTVVLAAILSVAFEVKISCENPDLTTSCHPDPSHHPFPPDKSILRLCGPPSA